MVSQHVTDRDPMRQAPQRSPARRGAERRCCGAARLAGRSGAGRGRHRCPGKFSGGPGGSQPLVSGVASKPPANFSVLKVPYE